MVASGSIAIHQLCLFLNQLWNFIFIITPPFSVLVATPSSG